ncbi:hypothetical protein ACIRBY_24900 [Streptomyces sp. NPDC096136]|uniref:hypothetical protein n=1 Tax=Streptomyces sp. NPDC096136 TaxID=3366076 RepID=UPI003804BAC8
MPAAGDRHDGRHLVKAGLLVYLGGDIAFPDAHPGQVAALGRRRDLPALLDRHVPLGPDQAAVRLGLRRSCFDMAVKLGLVATVASVDIEDRLSGWMTDEAAEQLAVLSGGSGRRWAG